MTQGTIIPPAVDQDSIEYGHVYANYVKSVADTPGDPDADPDIIHVNGQVTFESTFPGASARGSIRLPAEPRAYGLIVTGDTFQIVESKLVDHEGREGVRLIASVDGVPISWQAVVTLEDKDGRTIYNKAYVIHYDLWHKQGNLLDINLPDLIPTPSRLEPPEGAAIELAERTIEQIEALSAENRQINIDVSGLKSEVVTLHGETGQRLTAAEAARAAAVTAKNAAEAAQSASEAARTQARTARTGAEAAETAVLAAHQHVEADHEHIHLDVQHADTHAAAAGGSSVVAATQAGIAAERASEAGASATLSAQSANQAAAARASSLTNSNTATTQAGIATTKAGEAVLSALQSLTSRDESEGFRNEAERLAQTLHMKVSTGIDEIGWTSDGLPFFIPEDQTEQELPFYVDRSVGTRVLIGDVMVYADSGWRDVTSILDPAWTGALFVRRENAQVSWRWNNLVRDSSKSANSNIFSIPSGFRPYAGGLNTWQTGQRLYPAATGAVLRDNSSTGASDSGELSYTAASVNTWPSSLPGTLA